MSQDTLKVPQTSANPVYRLTYKNCYEDSYILHTNLIFISEETGNTFEMLDRYAVDTSLTYHSKIIRKLCIGSRVYIETDDDDYSKIIEVINY